MASTQNGSPCKGKRDIHILSCPVGAAVIVVADTQGVALGYDTLPLQGEK